MGKRLQDTSPNPLPPEATGAPPSGTSILFKVLSAGFTGALLVLLIVWFRNQIGTYGETISQAISDLTWVEIVLLVIAGLVIMTLNGMAMKTPLQGIDTKQAFVAQQSASAVSNVIPGPSGTAARFAILHSWGVGVEDFTRGTVAVSIWNNVIMISMPGLAFLALAITGDTGTSGVRLLLLAAGALLVSVIAIAVVVGALHSERFARWLGRVTQRCVNPFRRLFRRKPVTGLDDATAELRQRTVDILAERKARLTAITLSAYWLSGVLLVVCLWLSGVPYSELTMVTGLALYSVGRFLTIIQVTPGGVGVVEVVYVALFMLVVPEQYNAQVVAGIVIYRILTYALPIFVGGGTYLVWRRMRAREKRSEPGSAELAGASS